MPKTGKPEVVYILPLKEGGDVFRVPSDEDPGATYRVDLANRTCSCRRFTFRHTCKHLDRLFAAVRRNLDLALIGVGVGLAADLVGRVIR